MVDRKLRPEQLRASIEALADRYASVEVAAGAMPRTSWEGMRRFVVEMAAASTGPGPGPRVVADATVQDAGESRRRVLQRRAATRSVTAHLDDIDSAMQLQAMERFLTELLHEQARDMRRHRGDR